MVPISCAAGLAAGYRLIDTSAHYPSEVAVADAIAMAEARGLVTRREVTICTKVWFDDMGYEPALASAMRSLNRLRTENLDLLLIHFPGNIDAIQEPKRNAQIRRDTWRALEQLQADGRATKIGVSNWTRKHWRQTVATCRVVPQVLQTEVHPRLQQQELREDVADAGCAVMAFCPLARGSSALLGDSTISRIAAARGRSPAQVALRWSVQRGMVPSAPRQTEPCRP